VAAGSNFHELRAPILALYSWRKGGDLHITCNPVMIGFAALHPRRVLDLAARLRISIVGQFEGVRAIEHFRFTS
jgi:hypothetical protein